MDELMIQRACINDFEEISKVINDIIVELFPHYISLQTGISIQKTDDKIKEEINDGKLYKIITKLKGELIGSVTIVDGEIESMFLFPIYQKRGYGRHVLSLVEIEKEQLLN
jgi:hypothetical protein